MRRYCDWAGPATHFMHDRQPQRRYGAHSLPACGGGVCKARVQRGGRRLRCALGGPPRHKNKNDNDGSPGRKPRKRPQTAQTKTTRPLWEYQPLTGTVMGVPRIPPPAHAAEAVEALVRAGGRVAVVIVVAVEAPWSMSPRPRQRLRSALMPPNSSCGSRLTCDHCHLACPSCLPNRSLPCHQASNERRPCA